jgi:hypothetical protein
VPTHIHQFSIKQSEKINIIMNKHTTADNFFDSVDYVSIIDTVKGIYTSDGSMNTLLDFERVLDEADVYAYKNWDLGELVQGPVAKRYTVSCIFMWPYKLMPDPRAVKRLLSIGCDVQYASSSIEVPVEIQDYDDFVPGSRYPKMKKRKIWFVNITIPRDLMDDLKEGSIDLADQTIDLEEIDSAYDDDLDKENTQEDQPSDAGDMGAVAPTPAM